MNSSPAGAIGTYPVPRGTETILIAEDEPDVRSLARATLEANGYSVLEAASGREALSLAESFPEMIHLILTDLVMQQMGGQELSMLLRSARPAIRTLFLTGYDSDHRLRQKDMQPGTALLQKPFTPAVLARKVREILDLDCDIGPVRLNDYDGSVT
jgi:CheY-like chemotaxis protein